MSPVMTESSSPEYAQDNSVYFSGELIEPYEIIEELRREMLLKETCRNVVSRRMIEQVAQEQGLVVTPEEIQAEADRMRQDLHLERASDTLAWLTGELMTPEEWEASIHDRLLKQKLKESLFGQDVERVFAQQRLDFEQAILYQLVVPYPQLAQEIFYQIEEAEISFYEAAHLYDIDETRRLQCGYEGSIHRWQLKPDIVSVVFSAVPSTLLGPIQTELGYHLLRVEEFIPAQLTSAVHQEILSKLFDEWLQAEMQYRLQQ